MKLRYLTAVVLTFFGVTRRAQNVLVLRDARVDPTGQKMAFSATTGQAFIVYEQPLAAGASAVRISPDAPAFHCFGPAYSPDGTYLLYLKEPKVAPKRSDYTDIILYNRLTGSTQPLALGRKKITQAMFAPDGKRIVYCVAGFFGSYSPVGPKAAHELDVHSMALDGSNAVQHSRLKAYSMGKLTALKAPDTYLINVFDPRLKLSGTYAYTLSDSTQLARIPDKIAEARHLEHLPNITSSQQKLVAYSIGNELFVKNMKNGVSESVYTGDVQSSLHPMSFVGSQNAVIFSETAPPGVKPGVGTFRIKLLNLDDLNAAVVPIEVNLTAAP